MANYSIELDIEETITEQDFEAQDDTTLLEAFNNQLDNIEGIKLVDDDGRTVTQIHIDDLVDNEPASAAKALQQTLDINISAADIILHQGLQRAFLQDEIDRGTVEPYFGHDEIREIEGAKQMREQVEDKDTSEVLLEDEDLSPEAENEADEGEANGDNNEEDASDEVENESYEDETVSDDEDVLRCPECGDTGSTYTRETKTPANRCSACGHEWDEKDDVEDDGGSGKSVSDRIQA